MMKNETLDADPTLSNKGAGGGLVRCLVRLLGFGGSARFVKPECDIPLPLDRKEKPEPPEWVAEWDQLVDAYPVGSEFEYLGLKMIVVSSRRCVAMWAFGTEDEWWRPPIVCEYVDGQGRIREKKFEGDAALKCLLTPIIPGASPGDLNYHKNT